MQSLVYFGWCCRTLDMASHVFCRLVLPQSGRGGAYGVLWQVESLSRTPDGRSSIPLHVGGMFFLLNCVVLVWGMA